MSKFQKILFLLLGLLVAYGAEKLHAQCTTNAGTLQPTDYSVCENGFQTITIAANNDAVLDSGDVRLFVIHTGTSNQLGNILKSSAGPVFQNVSQGLAAGQTYQVAVIAGNAAPGGIDLNDPCLSFSGGATLTVVPQPDFVINGNLFISCLSPTTTLEVEITPPGNYQVWWSGPNNFQAAGTTVEIPQRGWYFLEILDSTTGCWTGDTLIINNDQSIPEIEINGPEWLCLGNTVSTALLDVWQSGGLNPSYDILWSNGETEQTIEVGPGWYGVTVTSPEGCTDAAVIQVVAPDPIAFDLQYFGGFSCGDSLGIWVTGLSGGTPPYWYQWNTGSITSFTEIIDPGLYSVTVMDASGCTATKSYFFEDDPLDCGEIKGNVFADFDLNCSLGSGDEGLSNVIVSITDPLGSSQFAYTDQLGNYSVFVVPGTYTVTAIPPSNAWELCQAQYVADVPPGSVVTQNIPVKPIDICPVMTVDINAGLLRRCMSGKYYVTYCNTGTADAPGAYIDVTLDPFLTFDGATAPYTDQGNNTYRFLLGNVPYNTCGSFVINVKVSCNAVLGQTHCTEAIIYPHDLCGPDNPDWSGASLQLTAECSGDELVFKAQNIGAADMTEAFNYIVIEDAVMLMMAEGDPLAAGEQRTLFTAPGNGSTWRVEAEQEPFHPGLSMPSVVVEGCTTGSTFSTGFVNQFELDDADEWIDTDCTQNIGSYDPNDKQGFPTGYGAEHYIRPGVDLEYLIRFQNTGTDTAFTVVIRDTLSQWLDPGSVVPGASSHTYRFDYYGDGNLKFVFDNILLPDSNVNLEGSIGYVSFRVSQKPGVPLESDIFNQAAIYFDFNEPIFTNTTQHRVGENFVVVKTWNPTAAGLDLRIAPNPANEFALLRLDGLPSGTEWTIELLDPLGRIIRSEQVAGDQWRIERNGIPAGLYQIRISAGNQLLGTGKLLFR